MKFGVTVFISDVSIHPAEAAREAEARGFHSMYIPEHTHIPASRLTPPPMGEPLPEQYYRTLDPFVSLTAAAEATDRIRLGTAILLVAQRDPIVTAKEVASLDVLSGGRITLGVGFGWNRDEIEQHGVAYERRRDVAREHVLAMQRLWTDEQASFKGEFVNIEPSFAWPKPVQQPWPPIFLGGMGGPKLFAAAAEYGDGWMPIGGRGIKAHLPELRRAYESFGRDPDSVQVKPLGSLPDPGKIEYFASLGVRETVLGLTHGPRDVVLEELDRFWKIVEPFSGD
jgi:probable F420-dependent oxidoreductase